MTTACFHYRPRSFSVRAVGKLLWLCVFCLSVATSVSAQGPTVHWQNAGTMPPGAIGGQRLSRGGPLSGYFQPVEIRVPSGARVAVTVNGQFGADMPDSLKVGLLVAPVYRLRVTEVPQQLGAEVFPTIEVIDRIYPPSGKRKRFPIPIEITKEDIRLALEGRFVTRVIYLENPELAAPVASVPEKQNWFEAPTGENPLVVADQFGRPVAILRIGSRVPTGTSTNSSQFSYGSPPVELFGPGRSSGAAPGKIAPCEIKPVQHNGANQAADQIANRSDEAGAGADVPLDSENQYEVELTSHKSKRLGGKTCLSDACPMQRVKRYLTLPPEAWSGPPLTAKQAANWRPPGIGGPWPRDEYLRDGGDFATPAAVRMNGDLTGLEMDDTIAHFDTLDGRTLVQPSNRVFVYSPRFGAVRRVNGIAASTGHDVLSGATDVWGPIQQETHELAKSSVQQDQPIGGLSISGASVQRNRLQGGEVELPVRLAELSGVLAAHEDFQIIRAGKFDQRQKARLGVAIDAALVWEDIDAVSVVIHNHKAFELAKDEKVGQVYGLEEPGNPRLRIIKIASDDTARPGDTIDFTLRFDNVGDQVIGNVTVLDNLSTRLEYVPDSAECSKKSEFFTKPNGTGSQIVLWEITDPLRPGDGGIIRFRCKVR